MLLLLVILMLALKVRNFLIIFLELLILLILIMQSLILQLSHSSSKLLIRSNYISNWSVILRILVVIRIVRIESVLMLLLKILGAFLVLMLMLVPVLRIELECQKWHSFKINLYNSNFHVKTLAKAAMSVLTKPWPHKSRPHPVEATSERWSFYAWSQEPTLVVLAGVCVAKLNLFNFCSIIDLSIIVNMFINSLIFFKVFIEHIAYFFAIFAVDF